VRVSDLRLELGLLRLELALLRLELGLLRIELGDVVVDVGHASVARRLLGRNESLNVVPVRLDAGRKPRDLRLQLVHALRGRPLLPYLLHLVTRRRVGVRDLLHRPRHGLLGGGGRFRRFDVGCCLSERDGLVLRGHFSLPPALNRATAVEAVRLLPLALGGGREGLARGAAAGGHARARLPRRCGAGLMLRRRRLLPLPLLLLCFDSCSKT